MFFGWLVLHCGEPPDKKKATGEINELLAILGLPKVRL